MGDLKWFFIVLVGLFFVWVITGGPQRISSYDPFIHQPSPIGEGGTYTKSTFPSFNVLGFSLKSPNKKDDVTSTSGTDNNTSTNNSSSSNSTNGSQSNASEQTPTQNNSQSVTNTTVSPYDGAVTVSKGRATKTSADAEYIILTVSKNAKQNINMSKWILRSTISGNSVVLPSASYLPRLGGSNEEFPVSASPGSKIYVTTGRSPIGISFRLNLCTGYLEQYQNFSPTLPRKCPRAEDEIPPEYQFGAGPNAFNAECLDYIDDVGLCKINTKTLPINMQEQCKLFLTQDLNYNACVNKHNNEVDFYRTEWRLYLKRDQELWRSQREVIELRDNNNLLVDVITY